MQTFLPYPSFVDSALCLDSRRLGKQRIEAKQLINSLRTGTRWAHHPAAKMWRGYEGKLATYGIVMCQEWIERGYIDNQLSFFKAMRDELGRKDPPWLGDYAFHASHRSNLLRKDPHHYGKFGWTESPDLPYIWPVN